jgi:hypothetical protein
MNVPEGGKAVASKTARSATCRPHTDGRPASRPLRFFVKRAGQTVSVHGRRRSILPGERIKPGDLSLCFPQDRGGPAQERLGGGSEAC